MAEIFFIASDERALDLIESLRIQSPKSLTFETDLPSAIRRLPKENPGYVFIQSSLDGVSCEEIATRTKALVANQSLQLVLLSDEESPPGTPACFDWSVRLTLPTPELTCEVMLLLNGQAPSVAQPAPPSDLSDLFMLEDPTDFNIPAFDDADFDPHLAPPWQPDHSESRLIFDGTVPEDDEAPPLTAAGARSSQPDAAEALDEIIFFVPEPEPSPVAEPPEEEVPPVSPPPVEEQTGRAKKVGTMTASDATSKGAPRSLYPSPEQIYRKPPQLCGQPEADEETAAEETTVRGSGRFGRYLAISAVLVLALGALFWQRTPPSGPELAPQTPLVPPAAVPARPAAVAPVAPVAPATKPAAEATAKAAQGLPGFIPKVPADSAYAAAHPGWERYPGDKMEFRLFREKGIVKAIQVIGEGDAEISQSLVQTSFKEATGSDLPAAGMVKKENGVSIETRRANDGAEVAIYRSGNDHRIIGFVLQPASK